MLETALNWSAKDGLEFSGTIWRPEEQAVATVYLVHGFGEHHGRYQEMAELFVQSGFSVAAYDQRGHGKSGGPRGHTPDYETMLADLRQFLELAEIQTEGPQFLYGHSFGGGLVLNYLLREKPDLDGAVVSSPLIEPAFKPSSWKSGLAKGFSRLFPAVSVDPGIDPKGMSRDPREVEQYETDELNHHRISLKLASAIFESGSYILENAGELNLPLLLMHGDADPVTSCESSKEFAAKAGSLCEIRIWEECLHELHHEVNREEVMNWALSWMKDRIKAQ
jgi:alpha-beta hydrolase superfamily lysophospholipase